MLREIEESVNKPQKLFLGECIIGVTEAPQKSISAGDKFQPDFILTRSV